MRGWTIGSAVLGLALAAAAPRGRDRPRAHHQRRRPRPRRALPARLLGRARARALRARHGGPLRGSLGARLLEDFARSRLRRVHRAPARAGARRHPDRVGVRRARGARDRGAVAQAGGRGWLQPGRARAALGGQVLARRPVPGGRRRHARDAAPRRVQPRRALRHRIVSSRRLADAHRLELHRGAE
jgi:hypothetical protein